MNGLAAPTLLEKALGSKAAETVMTYAEELRQEGRRQGREEGLRAAVLQVLEVRFGALPAGIDARVAAAGLADLERWLRRAVTAANLDEVFSGA